MEIPDGVKVEEKKKSALSDGEHVKIPLTDRPGMTPDDTMATAGRKVLAHYFAKMLSKEEGARKGDDTEAVHDMRVATRRMRSALTLFSAYYPKRTVKPFNKELKTLATALGTVRDLDVFRLKADEYGASISAEQRDGLKPMLDDWQKRLDAARHDLIDTLDNRRYRRFGEYFADFLTAQLDDDANAKKDTTADVTPHRVRHIAPALIYEQYGIVRAYEVALPDAPLDTLHALRIDAKRLRYMLESFQEILGNDATKAIDAVKALQDHLGNLQDARVAGAMMSDYLQNADEQQPTGAVLQYMAARDEEKQRLLGDVQTIWTAFTSSETRRALALSVAKL